MDISTVAGRIRFLLNSSLAKSTILGYKRAWVLFVECMMSLNIAFLGIKSLPLSINQIMLFIGYLNLLNYAPASILTYVTALGYIHKIKGLIDPTKTYPVQKLLSAVMKVNNKKDTRLPITINILFRLVSSLQHTTQGVYYRALFRAMYTVSFFGLMRMGEVTTDKFGKVIVYFKQLKFYKDYIILSITDFKHNHSGKPFEIVLTRNENKIICPVNSLYTFIKYRGIGNGPLFCFPDMSPVSREFYCAQLKYNLTFCGLDPNFYQSHSFRIGSCSYLALLGMSDEQIRTMGRWKTNVFKRYIRCERMLLSLKNK